MKVSSWNLPHMLSRNRATLEGPHLSYSGSLNYSNFLGQLLRTTAESASIKKLTLATQQPPQPRLSMALHIAATPFSKAFRPALDFVSLSAAHIPIPAFRTAARHPLNKFSACNPPTTQNT
jgi:hypothetical protein